MNQFQLPSNSALELSGPAALRSAYFPRQRLKLTEVSKILGLSYSRLCARRRAGALDLKISSDELSQPFVRLDDLIDYLYPSEVVQKSDSQPQFLKIEKKRGPGRPRLGGVQ